MAFVASFAPRIEEVAMPTFQTTDCELYYEDEGSGRPVVFIHGMWLTSRFFARQREHLAPNHRFIAPDLRGHGRSEKVLHGHTVPTQTRDLRELIEGLDLEDVVLVGWSSGAFCIWEYVKQFGVDRLAGAVIVDEAASDLNREGWSLGAMDVDGLIAMLEVVQVAHAEMVRGRFVHRLFATRPSAEDIDWMVDEITRIPPAVAAAVAFDEITRDYRDVLDQVRIPTLVCHGAQDQMIPVAGGAHAAEAMPDARLVVFDDSGHAPFWDEAERFNDELERFIASLPSAAGNRPGSKLRTDGEGRVARAG
jgi:pimeloyl-ACP methyl ester carboxylesterase